MRITPQHIDCKRALELGKSPDYRSSFWPSFLPLACGRGSIQE
jgi:hypothetical protein